MRPDCIIKIVDRVHKHVCGHASFGDFQTLLQRNEIWNQQVALYLRHVTEKCTACKSTEKTEVPRKVSVTNMLYGFNSRIYIDNFYPADNERTLIVLFIMDPSSRLSSCAELE